MSAAERPYQLARAWAVAGKRDRALSACQEIAASHPDYLPALRLLSDLLVSRGRYGEALAGYTRLLASQPDDGELRWRLERCQDEVHDQRLLDQPNGKLCLLGQRRFAFHRSGWNFALKALAPLHSGQGTLFDGFLENNFAWQARGDQQRSAKDLELLKYHGVFHWLASSQARGVVPYRRPWVGFLHNPAGMPPGYDDESTPQKIVSGQLWQHSMEHCLGLFTLSSPLARWLREQTGKPVTSLIFPSEIPERQFDPQRFLHNRRRKIIQVGWWLRRLSSIFRLPVRHGYEKIWLIPRAFQDSRAHLQERLAREGAICWDNTRAVEHVENEQYDRWLSENLVFIDLYDTAANCAVVECIARATPVLINRLEAVEEYLGADYPLYFENLAEAAEKAQDLELVVKAHHYLLTCPTRAKLSGRVFREQLQESDIYRQL